MLRNKLDVTSMLEMGLDDRQFRLHRELTERAIGPVVVNGLLEPWEDPFPSWFVLVSGFRSRLLWLFFVVIYKSKRKIKLKLKITFLFELFGTKIMTSFDNQNVE